MDLTQLEKAVYDQTLWDGLYSQVQLKKGVPALIEELQKLPFSVPQQVRTILCRYHMLDRSNEENFKFATRELIRELDKYPDEPFAQGLKCGMLGDITEPRHVGQLVAQFRLVLNRLFVRYVVDHFGLGMIHLNLAAGLITLGKREEAEEELAKAESHFKYFEDPVNKLRILFQKSRLMFLLGNYPRLESEGLPLHEQTRQANPGLCRCLEQYLFWNSLFLGKRYDMFTDVDYQPFLELDSIQPKRGRSDYMQQVLELYSRMTQMVGEMHLTFPLFFRHTNLGPKVHMDLIKQASQGTDLLADEMGAFLGETFVAYSRVLAGDRKGIDALLGVSVPCMRHSKVLKTLLSSCILEATMLSPSQEVEFDLKMHLDRVKEIFTLPAEAKRFVICWMHNLTPYLLYHLATTTFDQDMQKACKGMAYLDMAEKKMLHFGLENKKHKYFPMKLMCQMAVEILDGEQLCHHEYVSAKKHADFMVYYKCKRIIYSEPLSIFKDKLNKSTPANGMEDAQ